MVNMSKKDSEYSVFLDLLLKHQEKIYAYIFALLPNSSVADDLMQETVMVMWEKFETFRPETSFYAWAKKIAYYKVTNYLRKQARSKVLFTDEALESIDREARIFESTDLRMVALDECLKKLKDPDKQIIKKKYAASLTIKEIAEEMGRSIPGMYKVVARIHHILEICVKRRINVTERA